MTKVSCYEMLVTYQNILHHIPSQNLKSQTKKSSTHLQNIHSEYKTLIYVLVFLVVSQVF